MFGIKRRRKDKIIFYANRLRYFPKKPVQSTNTSGLRVNFPLAETNFNPPLFYPTDVRIDQSPWSILAIKDALQVLYRTMSTMGFRVNACPTEDAEVLFEWGPSGVGELNNQTIVILEHGWLPRSSYQISPDGSNARGHYARFDPAPLSDERKKEMFRYLERMLDIFKRGLSAEKVERAKQRFKSPFILFPFQLASDSNLRFSDSPFTQWFSSSKGANIEFAQACIDFVEEADLPLPVYFKQHPVDRTPEFVNRLKFRNKRNCALENADGFSTHDLFASGMCSLVIGVNSNTLHEAAVWDIPVIALGTLIWDQQTDPRPFSGNLSTAEEWIGTSPRSHETVMAYLDHVVVNQWFLSDLQNPLIVEEIIRTGGRCEARSVRGRFALI